MKLTVFIVFVVLFQFLGAHEECKFRKNYITYKIVDEEIVNSLTSIEIKNTLFRAFKVFENTIMDLKFNSDGYGVYMEELELLIKFAPLIPLTISRTVINCTSNMAPKYEDEISTIHNATILFNSNVIWKIDGNSSTDGINFFVKTVHELGHVFGLVDNTNPLSIMNSNDNFNVLGENDELPEIDREALAEKYFLKTLKKYF